MKSILNKLLLLMLALCVATAVFGLVACTDEVPVPSEDGKEAQEIVILYENDVHCAIDGYAKLAALKAEMKNYYDYVGVVSAGDFVQGGTIGAVSKGEYIINLMNKVGYDAIAIGNHEFDYQLNRLAELNALSNTKFISCNFAKIGQDVSYFEPYTMVSYGEIKIAYIGITTPTTISSSNPGQFQNEAGEIIYTFNESNLYSTVQASVDAAEAAGADYVIALSHIGYSEAKDWADITEIIENTDGIDVVLDAHTHTVMEEIIIKDKNGDNVLLSSTGTKFEYIGKLTITEKGFDTELIDVATYEKTDVAVDAYIDEIYASYAELGNRVIGESAVELPDYDEEGRLVRNHETALGNLCSDAIRVVTGADISFVNGGGLRAPLHAGEITFNDIFSVFPYNNQVVTVEVTGQMILYMLEMGVMNYPEENGAFPSMSGLTFSINTSISSAIKLDENGFFDCVDGEYRVYDVKVLDKESGEYRDLVLDQKYVLAGFNYHLLSSGDGMSMFKDATLIDDEGTLDVELLENYIVDHLGGVIGEEYANPQGRIIFTDGYLTNG